MNRKQFSLLVAVLVILGGLVWAIKQHDDTSWSRSETRVGEKLLKSFEVNDVAGIRIDNGHSTVTLSKKDGRWRVKERNDYPANFNMIGDLLLKIQDQKIIQSDAIASEQRPSLELNEPSKDKPSATLVELLNTSGKVIEKLLLGKRYTKKGANGADMPAGRYVIVAGDEKTVALIDHPLLESEPKPDVWINKDFVRIEKVKAITFNNNDGSIAWKMVRDQEAGEWHLVDAKPNEKFDNTRGTSAVNAISMMSISDVVASTTSIDTGMSKPRTVAVETFDGLVYTFRVGNAASDDNQYIGVSVSGEPSKERPVAATESPQDKERLDKEFKDRLAKLESRVKFEQTLAEWTYVTSKWRLDPLLKDRAGLMMDKQHAEAPTVTPIKPPLK
jgi:Domain of unknown function (DUF4340)